MTITTFAILLFLLAGSIVFWSLGQYMKKVKGVCIVVSAIHMIIFIIIALMISRSLGMAMPPKFLKAGHIYDVIVVNNNYAVVEPHLSNGPGILLKLEHPERITAGNSYILTKLYEMPDGVIWTDLFEDQKISKK